MYLRLLQFSSSCLISFPSIYGKLSYDFTLSHRTLPNVAGAILLLWRISFLHMLVPKVFDRPSFLRARVNFRNPAVASFNVISIWVNKVPPLVFRLPEAIGKALNPLVLLVGDYVGTVGRLRGAAEHCVLLEIAAHGSMNLLVHNLEEEASYRLTKNVTIFF